MYIMYATNAPCLSMSCSYIGCLNIFKILPTLFIYTLMLAMALNLLCHLEHVHYVKLSHCTNCLHINHAIFRDFIYSIAIVIHYRLECI